MFRPRLIPVLLLNGRTLYKSVRFSDHRYIGDPINAVRIFNNLRADELAFLDILATKEGRTVPLELVRDIGEQASMPFAVGGGIRSVADVRAIIGAGAEKVVIGTAAVEDPEFVRRVSDAFGASTVVVCMDVRRAEDGADRVWSRSGTRASTFRAEEFARLMEKMGAGELLVQSIDRDGTMGGYDLHLIRGVSRTVSIPVICLGGAGNLNHMKQAYFEGHASALAAGSLFVYQGPGRGVLINYPERTEIPF